MTSKKNSVTNALDILDVLGRAESGIRLKDIAIQLELPESTTHRLLSSLMSRGYVERHSDGPYLLGWKIVVLSNALGRNARLVQLVRPYLERLTRQLGHTVNLAVISNDRVMYLDCQTPQNSLGISTPAGWTLPIHATSLGKSMLAFMADDERASLVSRLDLEPLTPNTITSISELIADIAQCHARGYGIDHGEVRSDVSCASAPILDGDNRTIAAISVTAPTTNLPSDWEITFPAAVLATARQISKDLFNSARTPVALSR